MPVLSLVSPRRNLPRQSCGLCAFGKSQRSGPASPLNTGHLTGADGDVLISGIADAVATDSNWFDCKG
jgi:hypothetical protein